MKVFTCDHFAFPLLAGHRFPREKYRLLRQAVELASLAGPDGLQVPAAATDQQIRLAHDAAYLNRVKTGTLTDREVRRIGLPWSQELVECARRSTRGTISASRAAPVSGIAMNLARGTHHASRDSGQGYCLLNDSVTAARVMEAEGHLKRLVVLDCDVNQGNGTAALAADW